MSNKRLIKFTGLIGFATMCSRALGFLRDILTANMFGTNIFAEAFVVAFRIPNLLRDLVGEGAANAAFVPVLTEYRAKETENEFWRLAERLLYAMAVILFAISLCGTVFAPAIVKLIAPGFISNPEKLEMTIKLTRIMFPFILLIGLTAYGMGVLNSLNDFAASAFAPVLMNIAMIFFLALATFRVLNFSQNAEVTGLAVAVLAGGILQLIPMGVALRKRGFHFSHGLPAGQRTGFFAHPGIKRIWKLLVPRLFGSAVYQLSVIVDNIFSSFEWIVGTGAPAALWYSFRLFHLPLAIFGISLATAALPKMSKEVAENDMASFKSTISFSIKGVFLVLIPASIGLATLGRPIIRILFERGEFTAYSTAITYNALLFYSLGLFAYGGTKIIANSFFSLGDTRTPVKTGVAAFFINLVLNYILMWPMKIGGLALATSISATANFAMLYVLLVKKIGDPGTNNIMSSFARIASAGFIMGVFCFVGARFLDTMHAGFLFNISAVALIICAGLLIYAVSCMMLRVDEVKRFAEWILKRRS